MPIYEYACSQCGKIQDVLQKMNDPAPETCEHCGASKTLSRKVSRTSFVLKGGGWYSDLYGSSKKGAESSSSSPSSASSSTTSATGTGAASTGGGKTESTSSSTGTATSTAAAATPSSGTGKT
jgi:putative FmdB family regulatory protein